MAFGQQGRGKEEHKSSPNILARAGLMSRTNIPFHALTEDEFVVCYELEKKMAVKIKT